MTSLNPMVEEIIFGHISRIYRTLDNHLPSHGSSVDDLDQVHEILFVLEAADKLGVIWRAVIHFHVLPVEKENNAGDVADVKVSCVDVRFIHVNDVDGCHVAQVVGSF